MSGQIPQASEVELFCILVLTVYTHGETAALLNTLCPKVSSWPRSVLVYSNLLITQCHTHFVSRAAASSQSVYFVTISSHLSGITFLKSKVPFSPFSTTPFSVTTASINSWGVTSKAGFQTATR
jgi:hypothetical protein